MSSVVVSGYYGFGNLGDEAVLAGMVSTFRELAPQVNLTVLSACPTHTEAMHSVGAYTDTPLPSQSACACGEQGRTIGVHRRFRAIPRSDPLAILPAIRTSDLFISGGGGLLQDKTSQKSLLYYLGLLFLAQRLGCRTMIMAQGIGPLLRPSSRWLVKKAIEGTNAVTIRDEHSASLLHYIAPNCPPIEVTADLAFALPAHTDAQTPRLTDALSVSLRPWAGQETWLPEVSSALNLLSQEHGLHPLFIPLHSPHDREVINLLLPDGRGTPTNPTEEHHNQSMNVPRGTFLIPPLPQTSEVAGNLNHSEQAVQAIGQTQILLGMRLHSLIFAAMTGVPFVALAYDPKVQALAEEAAMPCLPMETATGDQIVTAVRSLLNRREEERTRLLAWAARNKDKARRNVELALTLLKV